MDTITMTGGIQTFKKLSSKFDNLSKYVDDFLNGTCSLIVSGEQIVYDFEFSLKLMKLKIFVTKKFQGKKRPYICGYRTCVRAEFSWKCK